MKYSGALAAFLTFILTGCVSAPEKGPEEPLVKKLFSPVLDSAYVIPSQVHEMLKNPGTQFLQGKFALRVRSTGVDKKVVYLNSERDYRDPKNVSVAIHPRLLEEFKRIYGTSPGVLLEDKIIHVVGRTHRVGISVVSDGTPKKISYYQTHIRVSSLNQLIF